MHMQKSTTTIQYPLDNDIMFALVMNDAELCRGLLERIFPGRKIRMLKVCDGSDVEVQNTIITGMISKSVRLDVLFEDEDSLYSIEMQRFDDSALPKRGRYYASAMDIDQLRKGDEYKELKKNYVIFICTFDYYGMEEPIYFFEKYDVKKSLPYGDGTFTIILNTTCPIEKVPNPLKEFFGYVRSQETEGNDPFIGQIHQMVAELNGRKEIEQIMTLEEELDVRYSIGKKEGREDEKKRHCTQDEG